MAENLDASKEYRLSTKKPDTGKYWGYGNAKVNHYSNWQASFKVDDDFIRLIDANKGKWINFSFFEREEKKQTAHNEAKQNGYQPQPNYELNDEIPF